MCGTMCELTIRTIRQLYKVSTPCVDDHHFNEEEMKSEGGLSKVFSQISLQCFFLAQIGRLDISIGSEQLQPTGCKHHTSNDMFSRCKSVQNMATGKSDGQLTQLDNKLTIQAVYPGYDCNHSILRDLPWLFSSRDFGYLRPEPHFRIFPTLGPLRAKKAMISMVGLLTLMEELTPQVNFSWVGCCRSLASWRNIYNSRIMC